jgi:hypothetical protein
MDMIAVSLLNKQTTKELITGRQQLQDGIDSRLRGIKQYDFVLEMREQYGEGSKP